MKPLRTGLGVGLLTGAAGAAVKIYQDRRAGTLGAGAAPPRVITGTTATRVSPGATKAIGPGSAKGSKDGAGESKDSLRARRSARRAAANRPAWVVAPTPGVATGVVRPTAPTRLAPSAPRKVPATLVPRTPVSAKSVGASVGKYAVKRVGKVIGQVAADRMGKAIEVIEVLEKVVASVSEPAARSDIPVTGPGAGISPPAAVALAPNPDRPGGPRPTSGATGPDDAPAKPKGTLVSVRKFERGPRVVVGPGVTPPPAEQPAAATEVAAPTPAASDLTVADAVEAVADAVEAAVEASAEATSAEATSGEASASPSPDSPPADADATTPTLRKARSTTTKAGPKASKTSPKAPSAKKAASPARKPKEATRSTTADPSSTNGNALPTTGDETP